jgi:osmotically-inducible protein OsmY
MKTDTQLQRDVQAELSWEPSVRDAEIGVAAKDGVVTLSGYVDTFAEKYMAEQAAERVSGVKAIADDLKVKLPTSFRRPDTEIAHAVVNALRSDIQVPDDKIKAKIEEGWVTLEGDVEWQYQRNAAERAVRYLRGVVGVSNHIVLKPKHVSTSEVSNKIKDALRRNAELDAERVVVEAADGRVTLKGWVRSYAERQDAERAAWAAPGVTSVDDKISINP